MSFSWSFSKLKAFETCPRRYAKTQLEKSYDETKSEELARGDALHEAMRVRVQDNIPLPSSLIYMETWAKKLTKERSPFQIIQTELKLAVDEDGKPTSFFDKKTWLRGKIDYLCLLPTSNPKHDIGQVVDYKTGKLKDDYTQLVLSAHLIFCHYVNMQDLNVSFLWTDYNDMRTVSFKRSDIPNKMADVLPRVIVLEAAHKSGIFDPHPCGLCYEYCPVTSCEWHGKRVRRNG